MAQFDPSVISQIPDSAPNIARDKENALKLSDLMDESQLSKLQLNTAKRNAADTETARKILASSDYTTPQGVTATAEKLSKAGLAPQAMEFMKQMQGIQANKNQLTQEQYQILGQKNDLIGQTASQVLNEYDQLIQRGVPDAQARAMVQPHYQQALQQLGQTKLPDGSAALSQQDLQGIKSNPQFNPDFVRNIAYRSQQVRAALSARLNAEKAQMGERKEAETERHNRAMEGIGEKKVDQTSSGGLNDDDLHFMAQQYLSGDKSVFQNLGRGAQGAKNIVALRKMIRLEAQAKGMKPQEVAAKIAEFNGLMSGERTLGTRTATIEMAVNEANNVIPLALKYSQSVPRGKWVPITKLVQTADSNLSDPNLLAFKQANLSLANIYARAISPTGTPTVSDKDHALAILSTATSPESYEAVLKVMQAEINAARQSPGQVRQEFREGETGQPLPAPTQAPAAKVVNWSDLK